MKETLVSKIADLIFDLFLRLLTRGLKLISPIGISPKEVPSEESTSGWKKISNIKIENRLNSNLYDIYMAGISKEVFSIDIISDDAPKGKTVQHMNINTNHLVVQARDPKTGNHLWIFRIHKFEPKEILNLNVKIDNKQKVYFKTISYSHVEIPVKEKDDGTVAIPFQIKKIPNID